MGKLVSMQVRNPLKIETYRQLQDETFILNAQSSLIVKSSTGKQGKKARKLQIWLYLFSSILTIM
jgi:hypothetical protein